MRRWLALAALLAAAAPLLLLGGCQDPVTAEFGAGYEGQPNPAPDDLARMRAACDAKGGTLERTGLSAIIGCTHALPDGGQACQSGADCAGLCLLEDGAPICQRQAPLLGCYSFVDEDGHVQDICAD